MSSFQYWANWVPKNYFTAFSLSSPKNQGLYLSVRSLDFTEITIVDLCWSRNTVHSLSGIRAPCLSSVAGFLELTLSSPSSRFCWTCIKMLYIQASCHQISKFGWGILVEILPLWVVSSWLPSSFSLHLFHFLFLYIYSLLLLFLLSFTSTYQLSTC